MTDWQFKLWSAGRKASLPPSFEPESVALAPLRVRPAYRERTDGRRQHKSYVCPAKMFRHHPDPALRALAQEQAREQHELHGPCDGRCRQPLSRFVKNDTTMRIAIGEKRAAAWREKIKG
jgi:hypothetical protein